MNLPLELRRTDDAITGLLRHFYKTLPADQYNMMIVLIRQAHRRGMIVCDIERMAMHNALTQEE